MTEAKPENLSFDDFVKFDIRVGTVLSIEAVPKSKKLLKLEVDFGPLGKRVILSGLAPVLTYETAGDEGPGCYIEVGRQVIAVLNLAPRTMMGIESRGMILAVHDENGRTWTISPMPSFTSRVPDGSEVG